jgi:outer membrane protein insertion porin family
MKTLLPGLFARTLFASLLLGVLWVVAGQAQSAAKPASYKLIAVKVTGSKRFTAEQVAAASGLPMGTIAQEEDFKKAARQLGESGAFSNVAYTYTYSSAGTNLTFQVTDADKFVPTHFIDFVWFKDQELLQRLREHIPLFGGELPISGRLPDQVSDVLQALLVENGIPGNVQYLRSNDKNGQLESIDYSVYGISIRIRQFEFNGADAGELRSLQAAAEKLAGREYSHPLLSTFVEHTLLPLYHEHGYLKAACATPEPKVVKPTAADAGDNKQAITLVDVVFPVTPGMQYKLTRWDWSGNKEIPTETLQPFINAKAGQIANTVQFGENLRSVQDLYGSRGHILATVRVNAEFDDTAGSVIFHLVVDEGSIFRMGELEFRGIDNTLTARLREAWKMRPGDIYDATYLKQFLPQARKLLPANLDWEVTPHVTAVTREKTVDVDLEYTARAPQ